MIDSETKLTGAEEAAAATAAKTASEIPTPAAAAAPPPAAPAAPKAPKAPQAGLMLARKPLLAAAGARLASSGGVILASLVSMLLLKVSSWRDNSSIWVCCLVSKSVMFLLSSVLLLSTSSGLPGALVSGVLLASAVAASLLATERSDRASAWTLPTCLSKSAARISPSAKAMRRLVSIMARIAPSRMVTRWPDLRMTIRSVSSTRTEAISAARMGKRMTWVAAMTLGSAMKDFPI